MRYGWDPHFLWIWFTRWLLRGLKFPTSEYNEKLRTSWGVEKWSRCVQWSGSTYWVAICDWVNHGLGPAFIVRLRVNSGELAGWSTWGIAEYLVYLNGVCLVHRLGVGHGLGIKILMQDLVNKQVEPTKCKSLGFFSESGTCGFFFFRIRDLFSSDSSTEPRRFAR